MLTTLKDSFAISGIGLHSGQEAEVQLRPSNLGGRYFIRTDRDELLIPATVEYIRQTTLSTELAVGEVGVRTTEHLLAALAGLGANSVRIEISGPEVPLLDGSAKLWVEAIARVGIVEVEEELAKKYQKKYQTPIGNSLSKTFLVESPIVVRKDDAFVAAVPAPELRFTYGIDFEQAAIGNQWHSWAPSAASFATEIAPARTFGFAEQIEQLRAAGLIKGGSLDNALVCSGDGWLNPPLRFANEPVRHKLLDLVGDLSLLGTIPIAHFLAYKASHNLHVELARKLHLAKTHGYPDSR